VISLEPSLFISFCHVPKEAPTDGQFGPESIDSLDITAGARAEHGVAVYIGADRQVSQETQVEQKKSEVRSHDNPVAVPSEGTLGQEDCLNLFTRVKKTSRLGSELVLI